MRNIVNAIAGAVLMLGVSGAALAADVAAYAPAKFDRAQTENRHIVVEVFKEGCSTCAAQQPSIAAAQQRFPQAHFMRVDFDQDREAVRRFRIVKQSTILVFKGRKEVGRLIGETDREKILREIAKGA